MVQHVIAFRAQGSDAAMPHHQQQAVQPDCNEPRDIVLATLAGNEYHMPANLAHYEDLSQLEEVFGCEVDLIMPDTKLPLRDPIHSTLKKQNRLQVIVRPCMEEGHSVWQFQNSNQEGYPKAVRVPTNARKEVSDRAFYSAPMLRHVEVTHGITQIGSAAWQSCHQLQIVKLPPSVVCLQDGVFQGCYALRQIAAPGCVQFGRRVFAECCSLSCGIGSRGANWSIRL